MLKTKLDHYPKHIAQLPPAYFRVSRVVRAGFDRHSSSVFFEENVHRRDIKIDYFLVAKIPFSSEVDGTQIG